MEAKLFFERENLFNHYVAAHPPWEMCCRLRTGGRLKASHGWNYFPPLAVQDSGRIQAAALILYKKTCPPLPATIAYSPRGPTLFYAGGLGGPTARGGRVYAAAKRR